MKTKIIAFGAGLIAAATIGVWAQISGGGVEGGGGQPSGNAFATQYKNGTRFGGTGPGTAGQVLTSNGNALAPTFQASSGGTVTSVAIAAPTIFTVSGSPVTTSGTLTLTANGTSGGVPFFSASNALGSSGALTANALVLGGGAASAPTVLGSLGTTTTLLHGNAAGAPTFGAVALASDVSGDLPFANLTQGSALSVLGVTGNGTADFASIAAGSDGNVLRRSGTALTFGAIALGSSNAVTGTLAVANGGTNLTAATDDNVPTGNGTTWESKALTSCSAATSAVTYNTTTNTWGCNTISAGVTQSTSTFNATIATGCTTTPTVGYTYTLTGTDVTLELTANTVSCTSNTTTHTTSGVGDVPAAIRPARDVTFHGAAIRNNGNDLIGCMSISTAGTIIWELVQTTGGTVMCQNNGYTASGQRGIVGAATTGGTTAFAYTTN